MFQKSNGRAPVLGPDNLRNPTVRQILNDLAALDPDYAWRDVAGVAVVRPTTTWTDPTDPLNFHAEAFSVSDATLIDVVAFILRRHDVDGSALNDERYGPLLTRHFSMVFNGGTILDALNALIKAHQSVWWQVFAPRSETRKKVEVWIAVAPGYGFSLSAPVSQLTANSQ
jgi:hypothetical protein